MTILRTALLVAFLALSSAPGAAVAGPGVPETVVQADVLGGWQTEGGTRMAAVRLRLAPGWKTYWRAPGDAGIPPVFDWAGSRNIAGVTFHWPAPKVFRDYGLRTVGYAGEFVLPVELRADDPSAPMRLRATLDLGVCEDVCIPATLELSADLSGPGAMDPVIRAALAARPGSAASAGVRSVTCAFTPISDGVRLDAKIVMPRLAGREDALVEAGGPAIWVSEPQVARQGGVLHVRAELVPPSGQPLALERSALRFTLLGSNRAVDIRGCG